MTTMPTRALRQFVGGEWREAKSTYDKIDPSATDRVAVRAQDGSARDSLDAIESAALAFPAWSTQSMLDRAAVLDTVAGALGRRATDIADHLSAETGKTIALSRHEVATSCSSLRYTAMLARSVAGARFAATRGSVSTGRRPLGVVGQVSPWNLPLLGAVVKVGPALLAGNCVVLKVASDCSGVGIDLAECFEESGLPVGVLSVLTGEGGALAGALLTDPRVRAMSWTGNDMVVAGRVRDECAQSGKRFRVQVGGLNSLIVDESADLAVAVSAALSGAFTHSGQLRGGTRFVLVHRTLMDEFRRRFVADAEQLRVGLAAAPRTVVGPLVSAAERDKVQAAVERRTARGDRLLTGGEPVVPDTYCFAPTVLEAGDHSIVAHDDEVFGPVTTMLPVDDLDEAIEVANSARRIVSAGLISKDASAVTRFERLSLAGQLSINGPTICSLPHIPVTGVSNGPRAATIGPPEGGMSSLDFYSQPYTIHHFDQDDR